MNDVGSREPRGIRSCMGDGAEALPSHVARTSGASRTGIRSPLQKPVVVAGADRRVPGQQFRALMESAQKVPFYRERFASVGMSPQDIKTIADIAKVPNSNAPISRGSASKD